MTEVALSPAESTTPPQVIGRYTILERIGAGGTGVVYRARDDASGRIVAFKQLLTAKAGKRGKTMAALFEREYHTLVRLKHPRIIEVYDYGLAEDGPYYTMELLEGSDLSQLRLLPYTDVCRHLRDVASSLALLHAHRLVHRDVSPRNIRLTADGTARLLDFGALATFGTNAEVIGTPPFMAPEILQQMPLDPRTDLFSLGAVGYYCLTGRQAFGTRDVNELPRLWQSPPVPPSAYAPDIPPELERLILSLLSRDPLGRPETAAVVIDQLTVLGGLAPEVHETAEQSYFLSSPMVGRRIQTDWILRRIAHAVDGTGGEVLIEGPGGIGKTRLANELCLAATLKGAIALKADAEATSSSFGVAIALAVKLLESCPEVARRLAEPHAALFRKLAPELADALGGAESGASTSDPAERRMRVQAALRQWFLDVARERTLLLSVDNLHAADDDSASLLAAIGRETRSAHLFLLTTLRTGSPVTAPAAIRLIRERSQRLRLAGLDAAACELLASGLFGGAANAGRVGSLLYERSGGVPQHFIDLAQLMVQKKIAKYEAGAWVLPLEVAEDELPARSEELLVARLSGLEPDSVALAGVLAIHTGSVSLDVVLAVSELSPEGRTHAVLDELLAEQVLVSEGGRYRFRHESVREAVLSRVPPERLRASKLRAAEVLLSSEGSGVAERVQAALHLVDAGEEDRGTRILVTAAREFAAGAGTHQNPNQVVRALCRMVRAYDREGRSDYELAALLFPLMPLAYYSANWQFVLEYGVRAIEIGVRITGLRRAAELESTLGREAALKTGLGEAAAGFAAQAAKGLGYDLRTAIGATSGMVPSLVGVYGTCLDSEAVRRIERMAAALSLFGEDHVAHAMYLFAAADALTIEGRESESVPFWAAALARYTDPSLASAIGDGHAKALQGGVLFTQGIFASYRFDSSALTIAERMEALGVRTWSMAADQVRLLHHSLRGESEKVRHCMECIEREAVQGAQNWQAELVWPALLLNADVLTSDAIAARRRYVQLERHSKEAHALRPQADAARAAYLMLRGDVSEAIALYERIMPDFPPRGRVGWETTRAYFARALNAAGAHERAKAVANEVLSHMLPSDEPHVAHFLEVKRQLALAEAGLGNHREAAALLDELLAKHAYEDNALLVGLLHQARAEVAHAAKDSVNAEKHRTEMERRFRSTQNPALIAQCERTRWGSTTFPAVRAKGGRHRPVENSTSVLTGVSVGVTPIPLTSVSQILEMLSAAAEPRDAALDLVMRRTRSKSGYLFVPSGDSLQLSWSSTNGEPPEQCVSELARWIDVARQNDRDDAQRERSMFITETVTIAGYRIIILRSVSSKAIVGGLILEMEGRLDLVASSDLFDAVGRIVEEHGDDALSFITA